MALPSPFSVSYHCRHSGPQVSGLDYGNRFIAGLVASSHSLECPLPLYSLSKMCNLTMSLLGSRPFSVSPLYTGKSLKSLKRTKILHYFSLVYFFGIPLPFTTLNFIGEQHEMVLSSWPCWAISRLCTFCHAKDFFPWPGCLIPIHHSRLRFHYFLMFCAHFSHVKIFYFLTFSSTGVWTGSVFLCSTEPNTYFVCFSNQS